LSTRIPTPTHQNDTKPEDAFRHVTPVEIGSRRTGLRASPADFKKIRSVRVRFWLGENAGPATVNGTWAASNNNRTSMLELQTL
jgi:hypothetical protein